MAVRRFLIPSFVAILALGQLPSTANAFGCPKSMAEAQAATRRCGSMVRIPINEEKGGSHV